MSADRSQPNAPPVSRRTALASALAAGVGSLAAAPSEAARPAADPRRASPRRYDMKKSINLWAFPYPARMTLRECLQLAKDAGFDGIELNYDLENDLSPKAGPKELKAIRAMAEEIGIAISGLCSFLFWPYSLTSNDEAARKRGLELAGLMLEAAHELGTDNLLVVPGAVHIPWIKDHDPVPFDVCDRRARDAVARIVPRAEKLGVSLNIENIFFNGYLLSPTDMIAFVDGFRSKNVRVHFDTGNIMLITLTFIHVYYTLCVSPSQEGNTHANRLFLPSVQLARAGGRGQRPPADRSSPRLVRSEQGATRRQHDIRGQGQERIPRQTPRNRCAGRFPRRGRGRPHSPRVGAHRGEPGPSFPGKSLGRAAAVVQHRQRGYLRRHSVSIGNGVPARPRPYWPGACRRGVRPGTFGVRQQGRPDDGRVGREEAAGPGGQRHHHAPATGLG
jgi:sugar phosphate isomerase/epimerase